MCLDKSALKQRQMRIFKQVGCNLTIMGTVGKGMLILPLRFFREAGVGHTHGIRDQNQVKGSRLNSWLRAKVGVEFQGLMAEQVRRGVRQEAEVQRSRGPETRARVKTWSSESVTVPFNGEAGVVDPVSRNKVVTREGDT